MASVLVNDVFKSGGYKLNLKTAGSPCPLSGVYADTHFKPNYNPRACSPSLPRILGLNGIVLATDAISKR